MATVPSEIKFSALFNTDVIESNSVTYFATFLARELGRRGSKLDMRGVEFKMDHASENNQNFFLGEAKAGNLLIDEEVPFYVTASDIQGDLEFLETNDYLSHTDETGFLWEREYAQKALGPKGYKVLTGKQYPHTIASVVSKHIISWVLGEHEENLTIDFNEIDSNTSKNFLWLLEILDTYPVLREVIDINIRASKGYIDYVSHISQGRSHGRHNLYSFDDKLKIAESLGIVEGSIVVLWTREQVNEPSSYGRIKERVLVRVDRITQTHIRVTSIAEPSTLEERFVELSNIDEEHRYRYSDIVDKPLNTIRNNYHMANVCFGNYHWQEEYMIVPLDMDEETEILVSVVDVDGMAKAVNVAMSAVDAIYWILKQDKFNFDEDIYRSMYYPEGANPAYEEISYEVNGE